MYRVIYICTLIVLSLISWNYVQQYKMKFVIISCTAFVNTLGMSFFNTVPDLLVWKGHAWFRLLLN